MMTRFDKIQTRTLDGITVAQGRALRNLGVGSMGAFIRFVAQPDGVERVTDIASIDADTLRRWLAHAEMCRVSGIGTRYAALLERCGITNPTELASCNAAELHHRLHTANREPARMCRQIPKIDRIEEWIDAARTHDTTQHREHAGAA